MIIHLILYLCFNQILSTMQKIYFITLLILTSCFEMNAQNSNAATDLNCGVVNISVCNIRKEGKFTSGMETQGLLGMPIKVLNHKGWYEIQTPDDYTGWVHRKAITPMTEQGLKDWNQAEKVIITAKAGTAYEKPDCNSQPVSDVVAGNRLKWIDTTDGYYKVAYPDNRIAFIPKELGMREGEWRNSISQHPDSIVKTAYSLMGVPYLWAGTSTKGVDCSGFVRTVLLMHDVIIPRDAWQQALVGQRLEIAPDCSNLEPGDLVFFGSRGTDVAKDKVSHVSFYVGNERFIHSMGDVYVSGLNPNDSLYDAYNKGRLLYANRILPYINKEKDINTTETNSYYK